VVTYIIVFIIGSFQHLVMPSNKAPLLSCDCNETWIFSKDSKIILKNQILWKSVHWKPIYSMQMDG